MSTSTQELVDQATTFLEKAQEMIQESGELMPTLFVSNAEGLAICALPMLPPSADARAAIVGMAVEALHGEGFIWLMDTWLRDPETFKRTGEAITALIETKAGFNACMVVKYTRNPWKFDPVTVGGGGMSLIRVPSWQTITH